MLYRIVNLSNYPKRLIFGNRSELVQGKQSFDTELTDQELKMVRKSRDFLASPVDQSFFKVSRQLPNPDEYQGQKETITPPGEENQRPLYEQLFVELFGIKSRQANSEAAIAGLEANMADQDRSASESAPMDMLLEMGMRIADLEAEIKELKQRAVGTTAAMAPSEMLNQEANPSEARRDMFKKIVNKNKDLRD